MPNSILLADDHGIFRDAYLVAAFRSGVRGFLLKTSSSADPLDVLRTVSRGGSYLGAYVSDDLLNRIQSGDLELGGRRRGLLDSLSVRELQVLRLFAEGKISKDIALILDVGLGTVRACRKSLMKKIGVSNSAGLVRAWLTAAN